MSALEIREKGVVVITFNKSAYWPEGGEIAWTPVVDTPAKTLSWSCRSTLPPQFLPQKCQE